jgi:hypothetical protein
MNEFLNSKSMVTPGIAGGVVTLITATLSSQFGFPAKWIAIGASIVIALVIFFADPAGHVIARLFVLLLNALIIFSVSVGANTSATAATNAGPKIQARPPYESAPPEPTATPFFHSWFE